MNFRIFMTAVCLLLVSGQMSAMTIYQYTGNNFDNIVADDNPPAGSYTTLMNIAGDFTVNSPLSTMPLGDIQGAVTSYSFNDGRNTLTDTNSAIDSFLVEVDGSGQITQWQIFVSQGSIFAPGDQFIEIRTSFFAGGNHVDRGFIRECAALPCGSNLGNDIALLNVMNQGAQGTWSTVPVPAAAWLFGSALGLLGWMRRNRA